MFLFLYFHISPPLNRKIIFISRILCAVTTDIYIYTLVILNLVLDSPVFTILSIKYTTEHYTCLICKNEKKCRERQQEIHLRPWPTKLNMVTKYRLYLNSWCRIWAPMSFMTQVYLRIKGFLPCSYVFF